MRDAFTLVWYTVTPSLEKQMICRPRAVATKATKTGRKGRSRNGVFRIYRNGQHPCVKKGG